LKKGASTDRELFDQNSLDQNCVFSVDQKFHNQLTEFFETFQLIKKFDQLPKKNLQILAVDQNFNNVILSYFKLLINCRKIACKFWQLIKTFKLIELVLMAANDHLIEFHLIEIVIFHLIESFN
jgi:hypothetical protein